MLKFMMEIVNFLKKWINKHNGDRLIGFTGSSVTIKIGEYAETFDEKQNRISSQHIGR